MNFIVSATTDIGLTKDTNQDSFSVRVYTTGIGKVVFAILCDGMGGLSKGEIASASVVNAFRKWSETRLPVLCQEGFSDETIRSEWTTIIKDFNHKIKAYGDSFGISVGTTVTAALLCEQRYYVVNVGDTRAYEIGNGVRVITRDHTIVAKEIEMGIMSLEMAEKDPRRNVLLQCIGVLDEVNPDFYFGETALNTVYMLCSDGFRHEISTDEIFQYLRPEVMVDADGMKQNMDYLIQLDKQRQESDNISVITIRTF